MADIRATIGLEPKDAVEFFRSKGTYPVSRHWTDLWQEEHARAFTVAKMMERGLLEQVRTSLDQVIANGGTFEQWKDQIRPELERAGWWGKVDNSDLTGVDWPVFVGPARLRTIYNTNLRMARAAGKWKRIQALKKVAPYLRYSAILDGRTRPLHRAWHGTILPVDHPWWNTHFPPCGWNCRCTVTQLSERDLRLRGWTVSEPPPEGPSHGFVKADGEIISVPAGIDPGFAYNVGKRHLTGLAPPPSTGPIAEPHIKVDDLPPLPTPRQLPSSRLLPRSTPSEDAIEAFMAEFTGPTDGVTVLDHDVTGEPLTVSRAFFYRGGIESPEKLKLDGAKRLEAVLLYAETLKQPDEIWFVWEPTKNVDGTTRWRLTRRYIARFEIDAQIYNNLVVVEINAAGWKGVSAFQPGRSNYLAKPQVRGGVLAYRRA
jgi:SPP1 gp7 family putative phage head morphogenesis protein